MPTSFWLMAGAVVGTLIAFTIRYFIANADSKAPRAKLARREVHPEHPYFFLEPRD